MAGEVMLVVDDHPLFRATLKVAAQHAVPDATILEAGTIADGVALLRAASRVQRLQQIVARGRQELGLVAGCRLRLPSGGLQFHRRSFQRRIGGDQRRGSLGYPRLQPGIGRRERVLRRAFGGHVDKAHDVAIVRHRPAHGPEDRAARTRAFEDVRLAAAHMREAALDMSVDVARPALAAQRIIADQVGDRRSDPRHAGGIVEHRRIAPVPGEQAQILVDDAHAGIHIFQRRGKQALGKQHALAGVVEQPLVVRYNATGDWGSAAIAAIARSLNYDAGVAGLAEDSTFGYGLSLSGVLKVGKTDNFNFMITGGRGIGRYVGLNLRDDVVVDANRHVDAIGLIAGFVSFRHFWSSQFRSVLTGSYYRAYNPAIAGLLVTNNVGSVSFDSFYSPIKPLTLGLGYRYGRRELENGQAGDLNRLQFSAQYNF